MGQNSQVDNRIIERYSNALYGIATDNKNQVNIFDEARQLVSIMENDLNFKTLFMSPLLNKKQQINIVSSIFSEVDEKKILASKSLLGLLGVLAKNSRLNLFKNILKRYMDIHTSNNKELKVTVGSVVKVDKSLIEQLKKIFSKNGVMNVKVVNFIDKDLLGGLIIQVGSNLIDLSIRTKLNKIKSTMKGTN